MNADRDSLDEAKAKRSIDFFRRHGCKSIVDLGCRHGVYTRRFFDNGFEATGVEARAESVARCRVWSDPRIEFIHGDVKALDGGRKWDGAFVCGILYHLDNPAEFCAQVAKMARVAVFDTHFAPEEDGYGRFKQLGGLVLHEDYFGRWFSEYPENATPEQIETYSQASFSNYRSFWPTKSELFRMIMSAGFSVVEEDPGTTEVTDYLRTTIYAS